jgi:hypothetical protein
MSMQGYDKYSNTAMVKRTEFMVKRTEFRSPHGDEKYKLSTQLFVLWVYCPVGQLQHQLPYRAMKK